MAVDVQTEVSIDRPRAEVAGYAANPDNAPSWYENIESVDWATETPVALGSRISFVARFLGRKLEYTYEVTTYVAGEQLVMRTAEGPFPMETSYRWDATPSGGTLMSLRNRGEPSGFSKIAAPFMAVAMRRANKKTSRSSRRSSRRPQGLEGAPRRRAPPRPLSSGRTVGRWCARTVSCSLPLLLIVQSAANHFGDVLHDRRLDVHRRPLNGTRTL